MPCVMLPGVTSQIDHLHSNSCLSPAFEGGGCPQMKTTRVAGICPLYHLEPVVWEAQLSLPLVPEPQDVDWEASLRLNWPDLARPCPGPAAFISTSGSPGARTHVCEQLQMVGW